MCCYELESSCATASLQQSICATELYTTRRLVVQLPPTTRQSSCATSQKSLLVQQAKSLVAQQINNLVVQQYRATANKVV